MEELDCFIVLENGGEWAMQYIKEHPLYLQNTIFTNKKRNYYHYNPPITIGWGLRPRENYAKSFSTNIFGYLREEDFQKRGKALIIDDNIDTGLTLNFTRRFLQQKGYSENEIFVFGKEQYGNLKIEKLSFYQNKVRETNKNLWKFINNNQPTTSPNRE